MTSRPARRAAAVAGGEPEWRPCDRVWIGCDMEVVIDGHVGYYCAGMNKLATVRVHGNAGVGLAENLMSGLVAVDGDASQAAGATGRGGLLVVHGNAAARCGISMKGIDIVVRGSVGHMSAFMAQRGRLVVCGDAGEALGDSIYEARLYVRGAVAGLGADCVEKELRTQDVAELHELLGSAGFGIWIRRASAVSDRRVSSTTSQLTTLVRTNGGTPRTATDRVTPH